jgi:zinc protease
LGGTLNGGTWKDGTIYYEVLENTRNCDVVRNDRMGFNQYSYRICFFYNQQELFRMKKDNE